jgi:hypothetical protein
MPTEYQPEQPSRRPLEPLAVDENGVRFLIGDSCLSTVTIWRLEKRGLLKRVPGIRRRLFTVESVRAYVAGKAVAS